MRRWITSLRLAALLLPAALLLSVASTCRAEAARFAIAPGEGRSLVRFDSKAPLESFSGTTHQARGEILLDPAVTGDSITVLVEVELAGLDTGMKLRNQHMRENHLHTDRFPLAVFRGARIVGDHPGRLAPGETWLSEIEGRLTLHGVERNVRVPVSVTYEVSGDQERLGIECRFAILLSDYGIPRPQFLALKVGDEQKITFRALAARTP